MAATKFIDGFEIYFATTRKNNENTPENGYENTVSLATGNGPAMRGAGLGANGQSF
jgi:hypothetical protein